MDRPGEHQLIQTARAQHGVFTVEQATRAGISRSDLSRRAQRGTVQRMSLGVYRIAGWPHGWHSEVMAACLAWGPGTAASHRCAAALWELPGFPRRGIELIVPRGRHRALDHRVHRPNMLLGTKEVTRIASIPTTSITRTLLDLAAVDRATKVEEALDDALRRKLTSVRELVGYLQAATRPGRAGIAALREMLERRQGAGPDSLFERRLLRLLRANGLPEPVCQHPVIREGRVVARIDLAYPKHRLAIEADGYRWHSSRTALERDARRQSILAADGWRVIRATSDQLEDPHELLAAIRSALPRS